MTWCSTSTSSPTAVTRCRSSASRARWRRSPAARFAGRSSRCPRAATPRPTTCAVQVDDAGLCPRFVGRYVDALKIGPVAARGPAAPVGRRHAAGLERGRRQQLRHARAGQAHPHLRRRARWPTATIVVRRAHAGEMPRDARPRRARADARHAGHRRLSAAPIGIAGVMGGAGSEVGEATTAVDHRVGGLRCSVDPPHRVPLRRCAARPACASRRARSRGWRGWARIGRRSCWPSGRARASRSAWSTPTRSTSSRDEWPSGRRGSSRLLGTTLGAQDDARALARMGIGAEPGEAEGAGRGRAAAPPRHRRSRKTSPRRSSACAATSTLPPPAAGHADARATGADPQPADRLAFATLLAGRGLAEVLTNALIGPQDHARSAFAADDPRTIRVENPVTIDHSSCAARCCRA